jgi:L-2-hydroxycarboxylate dehydrogenase (NAD+)
MAETKESASRIPAGRLQAFAAGAFVACGMPAEDAATVAELMLRSDLAGADGHGIFRLPSYVKRIRAGGLNLHPRIRIARESAAMAVVDGDNAMGHLAMKYCAELAVEKARQAGIGWVGVHHSNHAGAASVYASMPMQAGMIGLYLAVGNANHMPPWGGIDLLLSTNPIAIAVPAAKAPPVVLDMATSVAAYGKVKVAAQRGETMPEGWMIDRQGRPLTDPNRASEGLLLPIGGPKGYGLAFMFGLLAGSLNGAAFGADTIDFNADFVTPTNTGQAILALDIAAFGDADAFKARVDKAVGEMKESRTLPGFDGVRLPGERSWETRQERVEHGIPVPAVLADALAALGKELGIAAPFHTTPA